MHEGIGKYEDGKCIKHGQQECPCISQCLELEIRDAKVQASPGKLQILQWALSIIWQTAGESAW